MLKTRNMSEQRLVGGGTCLLTNTATSFALGLSTAQGASFVRHVAFNVANKGAGTATTFTLDVKKNGTSILAAAVTVTIGTVTNYSKADTDKTIVATAPTGWGALPALSATASALQVAEGDILEFIVTPNNTTTTAIVAGATVILEKQ